MLQLIFTSKNCDFDVTGNGKLNILHYWKYIWTMNTSGRSGLLFSSAVVYVCIYTDIHTTTLHWWHPLVVFWVSNVPTTLVFPLGTYKAVIRWNKLCVQGQWQSSVYAFVLADTDTHVFSLALQNVSILIIPLNIHIMVVFRSIYLVAKVFASTTFLCIYILLSLYFSSIIITSWGV